VAFCFSGAASALPSPLRCAAAPGQ